MAFDTRLLTGLNVLAAVVEAGHFGRAGRALGLTPSAVSRAVQRLEERLGVRLFERTPKVVRLTGEGQDFCREVLPLLARLEEAAEGAAGAAGAVRGRLRVNVDPTFARLVLAPRLGAFLAAYPGLHLELAVRDGLGDLVAEGFDAAVRFGEPAPSALIGRRLAEVRVLTCASPTYLARRGRPCAPADLARERHECLLFVDPATGAPFPWEFHRGRRRQRVAVAGRLVVNDALTHLEACLAGTGVAQVFAWGIEAHLAAGRLVNLFPGWSDERFPLWAYHPSRRFVPAKQRAFLDFLATTQDAGQASGSTSAG